MRNSEKIIKGIAIEKAIIEVLKKDNPRLESGSIKRYDYADHINLSSRVDYDGFILEKLDLSCFERDIIYSNRIAIEIKLAHIDVKMLIKRFNHIFEDENACFVLIYAGETKQGNIFLNLPVKCKLVYIDKGDLTKNIIVKKVMTSYEEYILEEDNVLIKDYYQSFRELNNISFALGAGCSFDSNISDWNTLSRALGYELLYNIVETNDSLYNNMIIANELNSKIFGCYDKTSALDAIYQTYIDSPSVTKLDYYKAIKNVLYMYYNNPIDANKPLMNSINDCIRRKNVKEIINYNFDSVLEQNYNNKYKSTSSEVMTATTKIGNCVVNHVHGYIPHDYDKKTPVEGFIFTDKEYYENMIDPTTKCNINQRRILSNYNVIFVGVSFTDSNIKEHLRNRVKQGLNNEIYGFLKLPSFDGKGTNVQLMEKKYKFIQQNYFDSLGVKILWVKDFEDIPTEIDKIK